jgi:RNAse (barnase) inhibitor barstar
MSVTRVATPAADAVADARRRGATVGHVGPVDEKRALLAAIGKALGFPSYYGHNLDALEECLGDLSGDVVLVWEGDEALHTADPSAHRAVLEVLAAAPVRAVLTPPSPNADHLR